MKTRVLETAILMIVFLIEPLALVDFADANPAPYDISGTSNVEVTIVSPQNKTYDTNNVELTAIFGAFPGVWYISYSLDGGSYVEIAPGHPLTHNLTETISLNQLSKGTHSIEVKATAMANDEDGTVIACSKVYFTIAKVLEPVPSSSITPTPAPSIPELLLLIIPILLIVIVAGLLLYFKKHKR